MIKILAPRRQADSYGEGHYHASRGSRLHNGIDFDCAPRSIILANVSGTISKLGFPYGDDLSYRYVELTSSATGARIRYFYVDPTPGLVRGIKIEKDSPIGRSQSLNPRYPGISDHVHLEVKLSNGEFIDPDKYFNGK